jgi:vesicle coat complex subunit
MHHKPADDVEADTIILRVIPRLQHANSSVVLATVRVIIYMVNFINSSEVASNYLRKITLSLGNKSNIFPRV